MSVAPRNFKKNLDHVAPATHDAKLGTWIYEISAQLTALQTAHNALLAHLDTANVTGIGNGNVAAYGATLLNVLPENRP